jgi:hypothetical protein
MNHIEAMKTARACISYYASVVGEAAHGIKDQS